MNLTQPGLAGLAQKPRDTNPILEVNFHTFSKHKSKVSRFFFFCKVGTRWLEEKDIILLS